MVYVTSDLHGYPHGGFLALLERAGFVAEDELYILGDVIDRGGDGGVQTLLWSMEQANVQILLGNHEAMLLSCGFLFEAVTQAAAGALTAEHMGLLSAWLANGAAPTLDALRALHRASPAKLFDLLDMLRCAPLYEAIEVEGRRFVLTHAGLGGFKRGKPLSAYTQQELLWNRPALNDRYFERALTVFGHTPTAALSPAHAGRMLLTDTWADVDTGAAAGGAPMLLRLDDMTPFYID